MPERVRETSKKGPGVLIYICANIRKRNFVVRVRTRGRFTEKKIVIGRRKDKKIVRNPRMVVLQ